MLIGPAPRFGLPRYLRAEFAVPEDPVLQITGHVDRAFTLDRNDLDALPETTKDLDLHCVMTWSVEGTRWTGWSFADLWSRLLRDHAHPNATELVFTGLDGAAASIALDELLREDVMVAHSRDGHPLTHGQGAPYRLVVPQLYGYKHVKHLCGIEMVDHHVRSPHEPWLMHRRGRVEHEERIGFGMSRVVRAVNGAVLRRALAQLRRARPPVPVDRGTNRRLGLRPTWAPATTTTPSMVCTAASSPGSPVPGLDRTTTGCTSTLWDWPADGAAWPER